MNNARNFNSKNKGVIIQYMDANFPFIDNFPLLPHLSHNDGKKIDLAFIYKNKVTEKFENDFPYFLGYGAYEQPFKAEVSNAETCAANGYWQYNYTDYMSPDIDKQRYELGIENKEWIDQLCEDRHIKKILIEPYLKSRLNLTSNKIRFQGCHSVRHDDHIHIEIK
jgi:hypothetical protein